MMTTTLNDYYDLLARHDWYYSFSDDGRVWRAGVVAEKELQRIALESDAHGALLAGFRDHYFSGKPWGTEKAPMPERPN